MYRRSREARFDVNEAVDHYCQAPPIRASFDEEFKIRIEREVDVMLDGRGSGVKEFTLAEGRAALRKSKKKLFSAAGDDGVRNVFLVEELLEALVVVSNFLLASSIRPAVWGVYRIKYIRKENSSTDEMKNLRPVSIGSVVGKFVERLFKPRLEYCVGSLLSKRQAAFQKNRSTLDPLMCVAGEMLKCVNARRREAHGRCFSLWTLVKHTIVSGSRDCFGSS